MLPLGCTEDINNKIWLKKINELAVQDYIINVEKTIEKYSVIYEPFIIKGCIKDFRK